LDKLTTPILEPVTHDLTAALASVNLTSNPGSRYRKHRLQRRSAQYLKQIINGNLALLDQLDHRQDHLPIRR